MNEQILINVSPQETRVAIMEQGAVQELLVERGSNRGLVGNIYLGRVGRVLPGMQSAFIEVGLARASGGVGGFGFLAFGNVHQTINTATANARNT